VLLGTALQYILVVAVIASGELVLLNTSLLRGATQEVVHIHVLFGVLLLSFVVARFRWSMTPAVLQSPSETYARFRHLKRLVYLLLYCIIAIRQLVGIVTFYWFGKAFDFDFAELHSSGNFHLLGFDPDSDGHCFIACGVLAQGVVRLLMLGISPCSKDPSML